MDSFGACSYGGWDSCGSDLPLEELDLTPYFLDQLNYPTPGVAAGTDHDDWFCSLDSFNTDLACVFGASPTHDNGCHLSNSVDQLPRVLADNPISMGSVFSEYSAAISLEEITAFTSEDIIDTRKGDKTGTPANAALQHKRKLDVPADEKINNTKKIRASKNVQKNRKPPQSNKSQKLSATGKCEEAEENTGSDLHSCSSYNSEDDNNSQEANGGAALEPETSPANGKTRASRGSATDPQSLYARKRRERINERLRILQTLVPNGTKVDISTMLEEAVHYVKFLQLQIKLLSSDELWMYAPIAYNGMDIGLHQKLSPFL